MSTRSRIRCAWTFANAQRDWGAMATLTFAVQPRHPKEALKKLVRRFRLDFGGSWQWAWVMEWQTRGVVHFHLFFERGFVDSLGYQTQSIVRHGKPVSIIRGPLDDWLTKTWLASVYGGGGPGGAAPRPRAGVSRGSSIPLSMEMRRFIDFHQGGIVELLRSPDAAARYVAKEAGKRVQKRLPEGVEAAGRWWWLSPAGKPRPTGRVALATWPFGPKAYSHIFDLRDLGRTFRETPMIVTRAGRSAKEA